MAEVRPGRWTAEIDGDFVVFLIGARADKRHLLRSFRDLGGRRGMLHMLQHLSAHPEQGLLGYEMSTFGGLIVQYWRSFEHLERYARDPQAEHLPAWRRFNQLVRDNGDVGIWHETYRVRAGEYETIYGNMPRVGLAAVSGHGPLGSTTTAALRIGERLQDEAPLPGY